MKKIRRWIATYCLGFPLWLFSLPSLHRMSTTGGQFLGIQWFRIIASLVLAKKIERIGSFIGDPRKIKKWPIFPHGCKGIFISGDAIIGKGCVIFQQVTIGSNSLQDSKGFGAPIIGDYVYIGAGAKIIGNVHVGNCCRIGANAVVVHDVPDNSTVYLKDVCIIQKQKTMDNKFYMGLGDTKKWIDEDNEIHP